MPFNFNATCSTTGLSFELWDKNIISNYVWVFYISFVLVENSVILHLSYIIVIDINYTNNYQDNNSAKMSFVLAELVDECQSSLSLLSLLNENESCCTCPKLSST